MTTSNSNTKDTFEDDALPVYDLSGGSSDVVPTSRDKKDATEGNPVYAYRRGSLRTIWPTDTTDLKDETEGSLDLPLILGMERTLFAALNNAWLLSLGGIGLMSVGSGDTRATHAGVVIMLGGVVNAFSAFGMHFLRVQQLKHNRPCKYSHTLVWTAMVVMMSIIALILELYFGVLYPYLNREKAVTIIA